jgi:myo-inositol-1(or 4)-monophosphatase
MALAAAIDAARAAGEVLRSYWRRLSPDAIEEKARNDFVSQADRDSERVIRERLRETFPDDAFLGEEGGWSGVDRRRAWIVDPLDGTANFISGFPFWCVSIALRQGSEIVAGVIWDPLREDLYTAEKGGGSFRNGERLAVSRRQNLDGAFLATGYPFRARDTIDAYLEIFRSYFLKARGIRRAGSAALDLAHVAAGVFDGFFEFHLSAWDIAAGEILIREAGGLMADFAGGPDFWQQGSILAGPCVLVREMAALAGPILAGREI